MGAANLLPVGGAVGGGLPGLAGSRKSTPVCLFVVPGRGTRGIDNKNEPEEEYSPLVSLRWPSFTGQSHSHCAEVAEVKLSLSTPPADSPSDATSCLPCRLPIC